MRRDLHRLHYWAFLCSEDYFSGRNCDSEFCGPSSCRDWQICRGGLNGRAKWRISRTCRGIEPGWLDCESAWERGGCNHPQKAHMEWVPGPGQGRLCVQRPPVSDLIREMASVS